jgi:hypothetical protein
MTATQQPQPQDLLVTFLIICILGTAIISATSIATGDDHGIVYGPIDTLQDNGVAVSENPLEATRQTVAATVAGVRGVLARTTGLGRSDESETVAQTAANIRTLVNDNSQSYAAYLNSRLNATTERDVLAVTLDGDTKNTTYVTSRVQNGSYTNLSAVETTDRTVDVECTLSGDLATRADDELERFYEEFVTTDQNVSMAFVSRMGTRYDGSLSTLCSGVA